MKRNIDDFDGMKDFIISVITVVAWVLIGAIIVIGYFTIETKGESTILSFVSTIFTIISSMSIIATILIYFLQKNDDVKKQHELDEKVLSHVTPKIEAIIEYIRIANETISNIEKYKLIKIENKILIRQEKESDSLCYLDISCDHFNAFIQSNKMLVSRKLFSLILNTDACYARFYYSFREFTININPYLYYSSEKFESTGDNINYSELETNIKKELNEIHNDILQELHIFDGSDYTIK